jgi:hypothetical protein
VPGVNGGSGPDSPATAVDFVAGLKQLKERSGRTFRQLEERAAASGDLLPRSTIADVLRRPALPRADLVAAFVRACGGTPEDVAAWLATRERLAGEPAPAAPPPARTWFRPARVVVVAVAAVAVAVATGAWMVVRDGETPAASTSPPPAAWVAAGPVRIHPAQAPDLCVTEGVDRSGRYSSAVAAQRPCPQAEPPVTRIEPVRDDLVHIKWDHPEFGIGCLTVLVDGEGRGLVEPQDDCQPSTPTQLFHIEQSTPDRYRIRPTHGDLCLGLRGDDRAPGTEVVPESCTGAADQEYLIEPRA